MRDRERSKIVREIAEEQNVDIDRPGREMLRALPADREFRASDCRLEGDRFERTFDACRNVEKSRTGCRDRGHLVICRDRRNVRKSANALQSRKDVALTIAEVRPDADIDRVHA